MSEFVDNLPGSRSGGIENHRENKISRREFLKVLGTSATALFLTAVGLKNDSEVKNLSPEATFILNNYKDPVVMIEDHLKSGAKLVALGEAHNEADMEQIAVDVIRNAAKKGLIGFVALELDDVFQKDADFWLQEGKVMPELGEHFKEHTPKYFEIFQICRNEHLDLVFVDKLEDKGSESTVKVHGYTMSFGDSNPDSESRDDHMSKMLLEKLKDGQSGIFYVGNRHAIKYKDILAETLGDKYYPVMQLNRRVSKESLYKYFLETGLKKAIGLDDIEKSPFSSLKDSPQDAWSEYGNITDAVILIPPG